MRKRITLIITCAGGTLVPAMLLHLRSSKIFDYRLVGVDSSGPGNSLPFLDAYATLPSGEDEGYVEALLALCLREGVQFVLPGSDGEAQTLSRAMQRFGLQGITILASPPETLDLIQDKARTFANLEAAGIAVPAYSLVTTPEQAAEALREYGYPDKTLVMKPSRGRGGRGMHVFCGKEGAESWLGTGQREHRVENAALEPELLARYLETSGTLVMPVLTTPSYDIDVLPLAGDYFAIPRKRWNPTGIPFVGNTLVADPELVGYGRRIASALKLGALHDIDLMTDAEGRAVVLEVNPRPSGSLSASLHAGFPLLDWLVAERMGMEVEPVRLTSDVEMEPAAFSLIVPKARG
ncbi:MAG: ATP-grasp domain-containing protein [Desulfovibrionaceae bacterium]